MRIGMSFWGFMGDYRLKDGMEVSAPDGCYFYVWSIVQELVRRGHTVYRMMPDRDAEGVAAHGIDNFSLFSQDKRCAAYQAMEQADLNKMPDLDVLFLEWRWSIPGVNRPIDKSLPSYQPDLEYQSMMLTHYLGTKTVVIVSDQDYKLRESDVHYADIVFDWGHKWGWHVDMPFDMSEINQFPVRKRKGKPIAYVGSRYERDDAVERILSEASNSAKVYCYGNWREKDRDSVLRWPNIIFPHERRITNFEMANVLADTAIVPLLCKPEYSQYGLMTCRLLECILFGAVPMGMSSFYGIRKYLPESLVADGAIDVVGRVHWASEMAPEIVGSLRKSLQWMDATHFVDRIEKAERVGKCR